MDVLQGKAVHECNDRSYRQLDVLVNGKKVRFVGAFHMDKKPMALLGTTGSFKEVPVVTRRRVYMTEDGDVVRWQGKIKQPDIHAPDIFQCHRCE